MSYDYEETKEEIIIDKGIATREMWKEYDHGNEHVSFDTLTQAVQLRNRVPLVLDTVHDHGRHLTDAAKALGYADLAPCPEKRGLTSTWHFIKSRTPEALLQRLRRREPIPASIFQFIGDIEDGEQRELLLDHIAILEEGDPRCPITRCGVGVYDSKMKEEKAEKKKPTAKDFPDVDVDSIESEAVVDPVSKPVSPKDAGKLKEAEAVEPPEVPLEPDPKDTEIAKLKAQVKDIREPLVTELVAKGYDKAKLNPLDVPTLTLMRDHARASVTQGLPGTVPQPAPEKPKSTAERVEDVYKDAKERQLKADKKRWGDW